MERKLNEIDLLALKAQRGDAQAREQLRKLLEGPEMRMVVLRSLQMAATQNALTRQVYQEYRRAASESAPALNDPRGFTEQVARGLTEKLMASVAAERFAPDPTRETVVV